MAEQKGRRTRIKPGKVEVAKLQVDRSATLATSPITKFLSNGKHVKRYIGVGAGHVFITSLF